MNIIEERYAWHGALSVRSRTDTIILHHAEAPYATAQDIHRWHLGNGWSGIGYHYYVRKDGLVYRGRPGDAVGAHAGKKSGYNGRSIGICFEGNYMYEAMPAAQLEAGRALTRDIEARYGGKLRILGHRDVTATDCPGTRFPMDAMKHYEEDEEMLTYEQFKQYMTRYEAEREGAPVSGYAQGAWEAMKAAGITDGTAPGAPLTREQYAVMQQRAGMIGK